MGGTGATTVEGAKEALGIPSGSVLSYDVLYEGESYTEITVPGMTGYRIVEVFYTSASGSITYTGSARFEPAVAAEQTNWTYLSVQGASSFAVQMRTGKISPGGSTSVRVRKVVGYY